MQPLYDDISASCVCGKRAGSGQVKSAVRPEARIRNSHLPFVPWQESGEIRLVPLDNVARFHSRGYRTPYPLYREGLSSPVQRTNGGGAVTSGRLRENLAAQQPSGVPGASRPA